MTSLHRIETLPGDGRFEVTFRRGDGVEHAAVIQASGADIAVAEAALPDTWTRGSAGFDALRDAILAVAAARDAGPRQAELADVTGGWDVMMGNVVLRDGVPTCSAHGSMTGDAGVFGCSECDARALFSG